MAHDEPRVNMRRAERQLKVGWGGGPALRTSGIQACICLFSLDISLTI